MIQVPTRYQCNLRQKTRRTWCCLPLIFLKLQMAPEHSKVWNYCFFCTCSGAVLHTTCYIICRAGTTLWYPVPTFFWHVGDRFGSQTLRQKVGWCGELCEKHLRKCETRWEAWLQHVQRAKRESQGPGQPPALGLIATQKTNIGHLKSY